LKTLAEIYAADQFGLSFELFPPKTEKGVESLFRHTQRLVDFAPDYITCTYGAGGATQTRTLEVISEVGRRYQLPVATHLTCVGSTAEELRDYLAEAQAAGVHNVVALRGDPPQGEEKFQATAGGFGYANELVQFIKQQFPTMGIAVGGYPETHQEAASPEADLEHLRRKVDAGADVIITQLFYQNADFFRFREQCEALGIQTPIVPGLLPVTNGAQIQRIASLCGAKLPARFVEDLQKCADDPAGQFEVGVEFATRQAQELVAEGVPGIHFYVLNKSEAAERVLQAIALPR
jgi:methylenetetrahydrofolate reductase (NADPH)